jgi:hypothetical protein
MDPELITEDEDIQDTVLDNIDNVSVNSVTDNSDVITV